LGDGTARNFLLSAAFGWIGNFENGFTTTTLKKMRLRVESRKQGIKRN
jgi:hypothetical protein